MRSIRAKTELALFALLGACACTGKVAPPLGRVRVSPPQRGGVLHTASYTNIRGLDPVATFDSISTSLQHLIYDTLFAYDRAGQLQPQLVERYDVSPDGTHYTFTLRRGVRFHDGTLLGARDVKRSLERALHPDTPGAVPSFYARILGYPEFRAGKSQELSGVRVSGEHVIEITLSEPDATFLYVLALPTVAPLCPSAGSKYDPKFTNRACGAGPFKLVSFRQDQMVRVTRHDAYWDTGKPYFDGVVWYLAMPYHTQRFKFEVGALDYMRDFTEADSLLFRNDPAWRGLGEFEPPQMSAGFFMNTQLAPFDNVHMRRAAAFAANHAQLPILRPGHMRLQQQLVPETIMKLPPDAPRQRHDVKQALEEMRLAGFPYDPATRSGGYPEVIPFVTLADSFGQTAAELYQQQLARVGLRIRIDTVGWPTFLARTGRAKTVPMGYAGWAADYPEPSDFYEPLLTTGSIQPEESQNVAFYSNRRFDEKVVQARRTVDPQTRRRLYTELEAMIVEDAPWALGYAFTYFELWQPYMHGYRPHAVRGQYVRDAWFDRAERDRVQKSARVFSPLRDRRGRAVLAALFGAAK